MCMYSMQLCIAMSLDLSGVPAKSKSLEKHLLLTRTDAPSRKQFLEGGGTLIPDFGDTPTQPAQRELSRTQAFTPHFLNSDKVSSWPFPIPEPSRSTSVGAPEPPSPGPACVRLEPGPCCSSALSKGPGGRSDQHGQRQAGPSVT